jgi:hypothetical protein
MHADQDTNNMIGINLAYYEKKDWKRFLKSIDDRDSMHATWKEWHKAYQKTKKDLTSQGFVVKDFVVNIEELINYCKINGIKNDGKARSQFVQNK